MMCLNLAIITVKDVGYRSIIRGINKSHKIHLLENYLLDDHGYIKNGYNEISQY